MRGPSSYGVNDFVDNEDGTISDKATGLMWMKEDSGFGLYWANALEYAENAEYAGYTDWRLPNAKELQSIVDYTRSPATTNSAAIDPILSCTQILNEAYELDYAYYWTSTTHSQETQLDGAEAAYIAFGRALGYYFEVWVDVHGAGSQKCEMKTGDADDYPTGLGDQNDAVRIENYVRLVRDDSTEEEIYSAYEYERSLPSRKSMRFNKLHGRKQAKSAHKKKGY